MDKYNVTGMSCAACAARVEKAAKSVDGVTSCAVNLLTNSMTIEGNAKPDLIIKAIEAAGYGAEKVKAGEDQANLEKSLKQSETPKLVKRLIFSGIFLLILMYFSMGVHMLGWPVPWTKGQNDGLIIGIIEAVFALVVMIINRKFFTNGIKGVFHGGPNMDTLVAMGSGVSYIYSLVVFIKYIVSGNYLNQGLPHLYFESAAMILTLITIGKLLESISKGRTTDAIKGLMEMAPKTALVPAEGTTGLKTVPVEEINVGDTFIVEPGMSVPVDGIILSGEAKMDESALTGESELILKKENDEVSTATMNTDGTIVCAATKIGEDTTLSQIIKLVSEASATKAPIARIADKVSAVFVPVVIGIAVLTFIIWMLIGGKSEVALASGSSLLAFALSRGISVLVISCPCALGLATPVAIMVGNGVGARNGILYKSAATLEEIAKVSTVVLDKTGTITNGTPVVTNIISEDEETLLKYARSLEIKSEHPLSKAVINYSASQNTTILEVTDFEAVSGGGLCGRIDGKMYYGGNEKYISRYQNIDESQRLVIEKLSLEGKTPLIFASEEKILGIIAVADTIKDDSIEAIIKLKELGINTVMLTGDNENTASYIAKTVGIDEVVANVLPDEKNAVIKNLQENGKVAMVGDGINDAISLAGADVGIAIGSGTDVAIDAADLVLVNSRLMDVPGSIMLGKATLRNIKQNLFWAFIYNVIGIPLAAGVWYPVSGILLNPMFGAAAMSLSSFCVVTNALRLNFVKLNRSKKVEATDSGVSENTVKVKESTVIENEINDNSVKENETMEKKLIIEGMMCGHCEARVKKVLEELDGVKEAKVSHEHGTAVVSMTEEISNDVLIKTVTDQGYEVTDIM